MKPFKIGFECVSVFVCMRAGLGFILFEWVRQKNTAIDKKKKLLIYNTCTCLHYTHAFTKHLSLCWKMYDLVVKRSQKKAKNTEQKRKKCFIHFRQFSFFMICDSIAILKELIIIKIGCGRWRFFFTLTVKWFWRFCMLSLLDHFARIKYKIELKKKYHIIIILFSGEATLLWSRTNSASNLNLTTCCKISCPCLSLIKTPVYGQVSHSNSSYMKW